MGQRILGERTKIRACIVDKVDLDEGEEISKQIEDAEYEAALVASKGRKPVIKKKFQKFHRLKTTANEIQTQTSPKVHKDD
jgi:hypothetical protein